jgi:hypothetical protein
LSSGCRDAEDPELFTRLNVPQVQPFISVHDPAIAEQTVEHLAHHDEFAGAETDEDGQLVAIHVRRVTREELHEAMRMPRRSVEPDEGIVLGWKVTKRQDATVLNGHIESMQIDPSRWHV